MKCFQFMEVIRNLRKRFRSRTLLEQILIVASAILLVIFISLVLVLIYKKGKVEKSCDEKPCTTEACLRQARNILDKMNSSIDPCEDFYEYACGSYHKYVSLPHGKRKHRVQDDVEDEIHRIIRDLLSKSNKTDKSSSFEQAHSLYSSCMNGVDEFESIEARVRTLLSKSGIRWPQSSHTKDTARKNIVKTIIYGAHPFYDISARLEDKGLVIFQLNKPKPGTKLTFLNELVYEGSHQGYNIMSARYQENLLISTFLLLTEREIHFDEGDSTKRKSSFAKQLIELEKNLVKNISKLPCDTITKTSELKEELNGWEYDVVTALKVSKTYGSAAYESQCEKYVKMIEAELQTYNYQFYLVWRFIARYLPFLSTPFRNSYIRLIYEGMNAGLTGNKLIKYFNERWQQCAHLVNYLYGLAIADGYIKDGYYDENEDEVTSLIDSIKEHYLSLFSTHSGMDNDTLSRLGSILDDMTIDLNYPDDNLDNKKLDSYYKELNGKSSFIEALLKREEIKTKRNFNLDSSEKVNRTTFTDIPPLSNIINMDIETNTLTIPLGLFRFPYYFPEFYKFAKYGGIGAVVAREMYRAFHSVIRLELAEDDSNENFTESAFASKYSSRKECYKRQLFDVAEDECKVRCKQYEWEEVIFDNVAFKVAYELYKKDMEEKEDNPNLPGVDLSSDKLFFLHYAQMYCEIRNDTESVFDRSISSRFRINNVMMNKKEFAETFKCKEDTTMNPKSKCELWE